VIEVADGMFESSHPFAFFDYFRIPYHDGVREHRGRPVDADAWGQLGTPGETSTSELYWPRFSAGTAARWRGSTTWGRYEVAGIPIFGTIASPTALPWWVRADVRWHRSDPVLSGKGELVAHVWRHTDGSVILPFDPGEVMTTFWSEGYARAGTSRARSLVRSAALKAYYGVRPLLPRSTRIAARRILARRQQSSSSFPRWPVETALTDFYEWLFNLVVGLAGRPVPWLAPWPNGHRWSVVLTHDVETRVGLNRIEALRAVEREDGFRSAWNFVALDYEVADDVRRRLADDGCEVGVHGLRHDGKDLASMRSIRRRLPTIRAYAERWGAVGFRAPATRRRWEWMPLLGFDYDSSYADTDPYEPQPGGCCSALPFMNSSMVELPITLPQDHTLFAILQHEDARLWIEKAEHLRRDGGMALVLTHPDYVGDRRVVEGYRALLQSIRDDPTAWRALPGEVSEWWRRRATSTIEGTDDNWVITGPAARDGRISLALPARSALRPAAGAP
jgi:hypothetical protein